MRFRGNEQQRRVFAEMMQQFSPETEITFDGQTPAEEEIWIKEDQGEITVASSNGLKVTTEKTGLGYIVRDQEVKRAIYRFLKLLLNKELNWGILTGVKPVKLYKKIEMMGLNPKEILRNYFYVREDRIQLLSEIYDRQRPVFKRNNKSNHISLYIGIPICPQKCAYCSFVSTVLDKKRLLITEYLKALKTEIIETAHYLEPFDLKVDTVYIGGGTPSLLNAEEARELISLLKESFDLSELEEFTFEAGRPDTTAPELLEVLKENGVNRLCLNPQSMNPETLERIGRNHTPEDIVQVFKMMRDKGFDNINMDLICGFEGEDEQDFLETLEAVIALNPEDITVHDLSLKKGSRLKEKQGRQVGSPYSEGFYKEVDSKLREAGYRPYYMYRQKYTVGNGENIGYSKTGRESVYNIMMMGEEQTIIGLGAGSTGKLYDREKDQFKPVFTVKDIRTYNKRYKELIQTKLNDYQAFFGTIEESE